MNAAADPDVSTSLQAVLDFTLVCRDEMPYEARSAAGFDVLFRNGWCLRRVLDWDSGSILLMT